MVAQAHHIIARQVHQFHSGGALRRADSGITLDEVARIHQQHIGTPGLVCIFERRHLSIAADGAVHVIGVQDHDVSGHVSRGGRVRGAGGDGQGEQHRQYQEQG